MTKLLLGASFLPKAKSKAFPKPKSMQARRSATKARKAKEVETAQDDDFVPCW